MNPRKLLVFTLTLGILAAPLAADAQRVPQERFQWLQRKYTGNGSSCSESWFRESHESRPSSI